MSTCSEAVPALQWRLRKANEDLVDGLQKQLNLPVPVLRALVLRGLENKSHIKNFMSPSFSAWTSDDSFASMEDAADKLVTAIAAGKKICIHGDFDTDGVLATVILHACFTVLNVPCVCVIPTRDMGHGMSEASVRQAKAMGADLIITVDCGTSAVVEVDLARELGMEVMVTDHHLAAEELPRALAIVNPQLQDDERWKSYCGAALALKLSLQLFRKLPGWKLDSDKVKAFIREGVIICGIATVADVVPLAGDNRALVNHALEWLSESENPALQALIKTCQFRQAVRSEDLAFQLIPRLNAAQRMGEGALIWKLFQAKDFQEARGICSRLQELNDLRKTHQFEVTESILRPLERMESELPMALIVEGDHWREGVSGLVASKLVERFLRPAVVMLHQGESALASCRAPQGYRLKDGLDLCEDILTRYGGHDGAAGFVIERKNIAEFKTRFIEAMSQQGQDMIINSKLLIDSEVFWSNINDELLEALQQLEPYGQGNPRPVFAVRDVYMDGSPCYIGKQNNHVLLNLYRPGEKALKAIGFGMADEVRRLGGSAQLDIAFHLDRDPYRKSLQLRIVAIRPHQKS